MALAATISGGWTLAVVAAGWLTWGLYDPDLAVVLTRQASTAGAVVEAFLVWQAARLGAAYRPALAAWTSWAPGRRLPLRLGAAVGGVLLASGIIAHDYLEARHGRLIDPFDNGLPSFGELVAIFFLVLTTVGYVFSGVNAAADLLSPWLERLRSLETVYRDALAEARRATATEGWDAVARNIKSPNPAVRARAYQQASALLLGDYTRLAEQRHRNRPNPGRERHDRR
jgi:hypothetical protein